MQFNKDYEDVYSSR